MSAFLVCPICGEHVHCKGNHDPLGGSSNPVKDCPLLKGGLHVFVKDEKGKGAGGVRVTSSAGDPFDTDPDGLVCYDQVSPAPSYDTSIDLSGSQTLSTTHYISSKSSVNVPVAQGKITLVIFQIKPIPWIEIRLVDADNKPIPSNAKLHLKQDATIDKDFPTDTHNIRVDLSDGLKEGKVTIVAVELDKNCEFIELTPA
jgi:hypothetical protein